MDTNRGGIDPIRLAAELLEIPYLEVLHFKNEYLDRSIEALRKRAREKFMQSLEPTLVQVVSFKH